MINPYAAMYLLVSDKSMLSARTFVTRVLYTVSRCAKSNANSKVTVVTVIGSGEQLEVDVDLTEYDYFRYILSRVKTMEFRTRNAAFASQENYTAVAPHQCPTIAGFIETAAEILAAAEILVQVNPGTGRLTVALLGGAGLRFSA